MFISLLYSCPELSNAGWRGRSAAGHPWSPPCFPCRAPPGPPRAEELQLKPSLLPASVYRSSLGCNHTRVYTCYLGLLWGCKHRDGNCRDFRAMKCEIFAIWSFRDSAGKPWPRVLWSWAPSGLGHRLALVPDRVQVSGLLGEAGGVHVTSPPYSILFFFFFSFNKYLNTSLCQPQLQLLENNTGTLGHMTISNH